MTTLAGMACAQARSYLCRAGDTWYQSTRPCPAEPPLSVSSTRLRKFGEDPRLGAPATFRGTLQRPAEAPEHLEYLSARCAEISEGIRTGPARGVSYSTIGELRREYEKKCREEDREARQQVAANKNAERERWLGDRKAQRMQAQEAVRYAQRCDEQLRLLHGRRKRADSMTDGERADLARFEATYRDTCPQR